MVTINRKTRYQLNLNSTQIRFDVEKLTPVGVPTDEKVALQIQLSQFMLKYSNQCFLHSILINTARCYCFRYCFFPSLFCSLEGM